MVPLHASTTTPNSSCHLWPVAASPSRLYISPRRTHLPNVVVVFSRHAMEQPASLEDLDRRALALLDSLLHSGVAARVTTRHHCQSVTADRCKNGRHAWLERSSQCWSPVDIILMYPCTRVPLPHSRVPRTLSGSRRPRSRRGRDSELGEAEGE